MVVELPELSVVVESPEVTVTTELTEPPGAGGSVETHTGPVGGTGALGPVLGDCGA